jgi:hypothetical protein
MSSYNSFVEAITLKVTVFGEKAYKEVVKVKLGHKVGALNP